MQIDDKHYKEANYLQSQNGNLYRSSAGAEEGGVSEFIALRNDVPQDIPWISEALGRQAPSVANKLLTLAKDDPQMP